MLDTFLRVTLLLACTGAIALSGKLAIWTTKPWWQKVLSIAPSNTVIIEPVGFIESGRVKTLEGKPAASQLKHRLNQINERLNRDLSSEYSLLKDQANVAVPSIRAGRNEQFQLISNTDVEFEVSVFKFDIAGLMSFVGNQLDSKDHVKTMIELGEPQSRLFLDVIRVESEDQRMILDTEPSLNQALETAACGIAQSYHDADGVFSGLQASEFCTVYNIVSDFQDYIVRSANLVANASEVNIAEANQLISRLKLESLQSVNSPIIHLLSSSLYRLTGDNQNALISLERAAALSPKHDYVSGNLALWRQEAESQAANSRVLASIRSKSVEPNQLKETYQAIQTQSALQWINYPKMLAFVSSIQEFNPVSVAILSTGFTQPDSWTGNPTISPSLNVTNDPSTDDNNGHGNSTVHLLAALLPFENITIQPIKIFSDNGSSSLTEVVEGFSLALDKKSTILTMPIGAASDQQNMSAVLEREPNTIKLAASGNMGREGDVQFPAAYKSVLSIGGIDTGTEEWAQFSPGPDDVDIAAPATSLITTLTGETENTFSGTSYSVVIVSALAAIARMIDPSLSQKTFLAELQATASNLSPKRIDSLKFIQRIVELKNASD